VRSSDRGFNCAPLPARRRRAGAVSPGRLGEGLASATARTPRCRRESSLWRDDGIVAARRVVALRTAQWPTVPKMDAISGTPQRNALTADGA
jgi:hypothetical protein